MLLYGTMSGATMSWNLTPPKSYILHLGNYHLLMAWVVTWKRETIGPTSRLQKVNWLFQFILSFLSHFQLTFFPHFWPDLNGTELVSETRLAPLHQCLLVRIWFEAGTWFGLRSLATGPARKWRGMGVDADPRTITGVAPTAKHRPMAANGSNSERFF